MAIKLPPLPYSTDELEPFISRETVEIHYQKHHGGYVEKVNELIKGTTLENSNLDEIVIASHIMDTKIFNNAAQALNHEFFWKSMSPEPTSVSPRLRDQLFKDFGSMEGMKDEFVNEGKNIFGSGWIWLVKDTSGAIKIRGTSNAENPMMMGDHPLLVCDVWEHAYYLDYKNEREKYLKNFWAIANWNFFESNLEAIQNQFQGVPHFASPEHTRSANNH